MAEMPEMTVRVLEETDQPYIVLPGKYAHRERVSDVEITATFQTLEEMQDYCQHPEKYRKSRVD